MPHMNPSYLSIPLESNNNANKVTHYSNCYGAKSTLATVVTGYSGICASGLSMNKNFVNRLEPPIQCPTACNVSNVGAVKLAPLKCAYLDHTINDEATRLRLRSEVPHLTRKDVDQVRLPFYELLCEELLQNGYHLAFSEMFALHQQQDEERRVAGPESALWYIPPLAEQNDKIKLMARCLSEAEYAARREDAHTVFNSYLTLGLRARESPDDLWLAEHFFKRAYEAAEVIGDDDGLKLATAYRYYGKTLQERGFLQDAAEILNKFYKITRGKMWVDDEGNCLERVASIYLVENFQARIDDSPEEYHSDRIELCRQAYDIAVQCGEWEILANVWLRLGDILYTAGNHEEALTTYKGFFDKACLRGDYVNLAKVTEALAKLCKSMNNMEECIKYLQKFANSCERHGQWLELGRACQMLGSAYDQVGDHAAALKWIKKSYTLPQMIQTIKTDVYKETMEESRIMLGVARAHLMHDRYCKTIIQNTPTTVQKLIDWKAKPKDEDKLFPTGDMDLTHTSFDSQKPKRDVLEYAQHPATGFLYRPLS